MGGSGGKGGRGCRELRDMCKGSRGRWGGCLLVMSIGKGDAESGGGAEGKALRGGPQLCVCVCRGRVEWGG